MDPRNSAKVTAPDLLEAFHESAPRQDQQPDSAPTLYVAFVHDDDVKAAKQFPMLQVRAMLEEVHEWLTKGDGYGVLVFAGLVPPMAYQDALEAVSDTGD